MDVDCEGDSVVSGSTQMSDSSQCLQNHDVCKGLEALQEIQNLSRAPAKETATGNTGSEMSPLVPLQLHIQKCSDMEDTASDISEPLIPLIAPAHPAERVNNKPSIQTKFQDNQIVEESQSLLPQMAVVHSAQSVSMQNGGGEICESQRIVSPSQPASLQNRGGKMSESQRVVTPSQPSSLQNGGGKMSESQRVVTPSQPASLQKGGGEISETQRVVTLSQLASLQNGGEEMSESQSVVTPSLPAFLQNGGGEISESQREGTSSQSINLLSGREGEIIQSQGTVILFSTGKEEMIQTQRAVTPISIESDSTSRIRDRLDRLVASLDKVPRRQMMVMEATILQCITHLQDNLNNKLRKRSSTDDPTGGLRKLLQTSQTGLMKLAAQHKKEKLQLSQTGNQSIQQTAFRNSQQSKSGVQSALSDLVKRQRRVFNMLKRQKCLVDLLKTSKRPSAAGPEPQNTQQAQADYLPSSTQQARSDNDLKQRFEHGIDTACTNSRRYPGNIVRSHDEKPSTQRNRNVYESVSNGVRIEEIVEEQKVTDRGNPSDGVSSERKSTLDNDELILEHDDGLKVQDQENSESHIIDEEVGTHSQDVTTIPDTQDLNTQIIINTSGKALSQTIGSVGNNCTSEQVQSQDSENELQIQNYLDGHYVVENDCVGTVNRKMRTNNLDENIDRSESSPLKRVHVEKETADETVKKQRLNYIDNSCERDILNDNKTSSTDKVGLKPNSEMLWLSMLRTDTSKVKESLQVTDVSKPEVQNVQETFSARKLDIEVSRSEIERTKSRKILAHGMEKCRTDVQFVTATDNNGQELQKVENNYVLKEYVDQKKFNNRASNEHIIQGNQVDQTGLKPTRAMKDGHFLSPNAREHVNTALSSLPNVTVPGETWYNVSPTATSMSSDVFMVKATELHKRMKRRAELSQNISERIHPACHLHANMRSIISSNKVESIDQNNNQIKITVDNVKKINELDSLIETNKIYPGKLNAVKDTVTDAIDSVIKRSREIAANKNDFSSKGNINTQVKPARMYADNTIGINTAIVRSKGNTHTPLKPSIIDADTIGINPTILKVQKFPPITGIDGTPTLRSQAPLFGASGTRTGRQMLPVCLPTMKELVQSGQITPGKYVLSCELKGNTHRASLTPLGKIRTEAGLVFGTVSQWLSTFSDGELVKKQKAYEMILYKGRQLLSFCTDYTHVQHGKLNTTGSSLHVKSHNTKVSTEQTPRVERSEINTEFSKLTEDERRLDWLLSNCVVRLLTVHDFVSSADLPDNFWSEDFSKVRLHTDIWDTVDAW